MIQSPKMATGSLQSKKKVVKKTPSQNPKNKAKVAKGSKKAAPKEAGAKKPFFSKNNFKSLKIAAKKPVPVAVPVVAKSKPK